MELQKLQNEYAATNGIQELDEAGLFHHVIRELQRSKMNKL
jgi:tRNA nucleotidyltransferase/poly(A) polymerase